MRQRDSLCRQKCLYDNKIVDKQTITIDTLSGIKRCRYMLRGGEVYAVKVDMGKAVLTPNLIPVKLGGEEVIDRPVTIGDTPYNITCVSMGNPHCVVFVDSVDTLDIEKVGPMFENSELFPERINTEFIRVLDSHTLKMRVWERGSGETWACGTECVRGGCRSGGKRPLPEGRGHHREAARRRFGD